MKVEPPPGGFAGPVKRSVTIAGHPTSISLEPIFWDALEAAAAERALPLNALIAAIDHARIGAEEPPNLASAIRSWLMAERRTSSSPGGGGGPPQAVEG
ncbi:ribbon-helix-helix domain-containing protein [Stakelama tenebrarum]|uniref:Ribbon-helix-helix domain-containing protein n=1 Tax=Stakelama tenebrarum TaxID=2711215 RepID=A0A6G6Y2S5_9SPHN|nr:ribbon-helix-helix domain-containing protein [Sphingosinithalassobacter tenebrarum]QIG79200.1 ribbon-helix-helix domain-containing protein [Sphingosinithalassobacter tenebrarum]